MKVNFTTRDWLWFCIVVALLMSWLMDRGRMAWTPHGESLAEWINLLRLNE